MGLLKYQLIFISALIIFSCGQIGSTESEPSKNDSLILKIYFQPAFEEVSETTLWNIDSKQGIQILIKNNIRADVKEDTFWFKKVYLSDRQYLHLDSTLIKMCRQKIIPKNHVGFDGMTISTFLTNSIDSNLISYWSPSKDTDSVGYLFTKSLFKILGNTFQDTLTNQYFNDLEVYIDESKFQKADPKREIDQLRIKKYNWTIRKSE